MRAPAPWLVGDKRLVGVEACEEVDVGVVILGGTPAGPGNEGGEATLPGQLAGSRLARIVFGALDPHSTSFFLCSFCCVVLAHDAALPSLTGGYICLVQYSCLGKELCHYARHANPTMTNVRVTSLAVC